MSKKLLELNYIRNIKRKKVLHMLHFVLTFFFVGMRGTPRVKL